MTFWCRFRKLLDKSNEFSTETEPHETAIAKDETNAEQAREILVESTLTAGAATVTEYEEHSENEISNKLSRH